MSKLVILKLGQGSLDRGFPVNMQMSKDGSHLKTGLDGSLPAAPELRQRLQKWRNTYRSGTRGRLEAVKGVTNSSDYSDIDQPFTTSINDWINSQSFREIREKLLQQLSRDDEVRVIVQTEDSDLRRLPWHLWKFFDDYPKAEFALSAPTFGEIHKSITPKNKVRILAILGDSTEINVEADRQFLERLPNAEVKFLVEPKRDRLNEQLWDEKGWDIFFFAGHSSSSENADTGRINLNSSDSLSLKELKYAMQKASQMGLQLAIFNSCDGLGLAKSLADLNIPQIIVMREPIPDVVAQKFLKYFLQAYAERNKSLYMAVREARERLHGHEAEVQFRFASWLPVIYQNLAEVPPSWEQLRGTLPLRAHTSARTDRKSIYLVTGMVAALIAAVFIGVKLISQPKPALNPANSSQELAANNWLVYEAAEESIKIKYPQDWSRQDIKDPLTKELVSFSPKNRSQSGVNITLSFDDLSNSPLTLEEFSKSTIDKIRQYTENAKILEATATTLGNRRAYKIIYTGRDFNQNLKKMQVWALHKNKAYTVTYAAQENQYDSSLKTAKEMIDSFEILD